MDPSKESTFLGLLLSEDDNHIPNAQHASLPVYEEEQQVIINKEALPDDEERLKDEPSGHLVVGRMFLAKEIQLRAEKQQRELMPSLFAGSQIPSITTRSKMEIMRGGPEEDHTVKKGKKRGKRNELAPYLSSPIKRVNIKQEPSD
jgi:hypothetical protein